MKKHYFELTGQAMKQVNKQSAIVADVSNIQLGGFINMKFSYFKIWAKYLVGTKTCHLECMLLLITSGLK